ncbi:MAG: undecaprenyldiphospho-muramoylpentapeptide beta-N-acetylglucosaminyltransferase [Sporomusaceae bacterium]|nr:undecaprenyldiphospho-muramoylpentapeptide beta-N-acetylglucosaminyltransferase [Sporomusaceae bacterium]
MRILISGGGTGGHIYPALAIVKALERLAEPAEIVFVGTQEGLESDIVPKEGYQLLTIQVGGLERRLSWRNVQTLARTLGGVWQSRAILRRFQPDIVIGTGGYVCGPVLLMASLLNIPSLIQEQNAIPGITNRILARFADRIAVGYAEAIPRFAATSKTVVTGNPIRDDVMAISREQGQQELGLDPDKLTILISGGSRGAQSINKAAIPVVKALASRPGIQLLHVTGKNDYNNIVGLYNQAGIEPGKNGNISIRPYLYNMPHALAAADLAVFRAGAIGLAELTARGIPAILVPYPYAAENHQEHNARVLEANGAAVVIRDAELNGDALLAAMEDLLADPQKRLAMARASKSMGRPEAAARIAELAVSLARGKR